MKKIFKWLKKNNYQIWAHARSENDLRIVPVDDFKSADFSSEIPISSWKQAIFPPKHTLFEFDKFGVKSRSQSRKVALFGVRIFDLEAINLYDAVFADDPYYQERRKNILVIGFAPKVEEDNPNKTFSEERLSYYKFDIFFDEKSKTYFTGSERGKKILKKLKIISPTPSLPLPKGEGKGGGLASGGVLNQRFSSSTIWKNFLEWKKVVESTSDSKVWDELGKTCLACGKCSIACPTCFCFDIADEFKPPHSPPISPKAKQGESEGVTRNRCWGNCFYQEFHRVAQNNFLVDNIRDRIAFWYTHKFVRIPNDYKLRGCVGCGRCAKVCPADINIKKNLKKLKESLKNKITS